MGSAFPTIEKSATGIPGFDEITYGGLPQSRCSIVVGGPGSGKTVLASQFLAYGAMNADEAGVFVAFEENSQRILANMASFNLGLQSLAESRICFLDARVRFDLVLSGNYDIEGLLALIAAKVDQLGAKRLVLDGIDLFLFLLNDQVVERRELGRLHQWLVERGITSIITVKASNDDSQLSDRYGFLHYLADCVVSLQHRVVDQVSTRSMRIAKYRGSYFLSNEFPFAFTSRGIELAANVPTNDEFTASSERVPTGIDRLDNMLEGGYFRGSCILISGNPGTAKSTLAGAYVAAASTRGESIVYVSFDEAADEIVRNMSSVAIHLRPARECGRLYFHSAPADSMAAEEHIVTIRNLLSQHQARHLVIDPVSAVIRSGGLSSATHVLNHLLGFAKQAGVTVLMTSLLDKHDFRDEATAIQVSTIADCWIHLAYQVRGGERNRSLTIVKSRGTKHSNQVREVILSRQGVTLRDVYTAGGDVLMGTARWEREEQERTKIMQDNDLIETRQRELVKQEKEIAARSAALAEELKACQHEMEQLQMKKAKADANALSKEMVLRELRQAD